MLATDFLHNGIAVIPVMARDKRPRMAWEKYQREMPSEKDVLDWMQHGANYGVVCGWQNLAVIDFDDDAGYRKWRGWSMTRGGIAKHVAQNAFQVATGHGMHVYVRTEHAERGRKLGTPTLVNGKEKYAVEVRGAKQYVLGPGSIHPSGAGYVALRERLYIPKIETLSDVLPVELLTATNTGQPIAAVAGRTPTLLQGDAWERADAMTQSAGLGAVTRIHKNWHIEDLVKLEQKTGDHHWLSKCPLHDDQSPSFWIDTRREICGCYSGCNSKPMDVIDLAARMWGVSNREAIAVMAQR